MTIRRKAVSYEGDGQVFEGWACWDAAVAGDRPGVLIAHAFGGQGAFELEKAEALAALGYLAFAADLYGKGRRAGSPAEATALMNELDNDRALLLRRIGLSLTTLKNLPLVDAPRTAAIGYCFGGKCVLDLARSRADTLGVASFHGLLDPPPSIPAGRGRPSILVLHGWNDPLAKPTDVERLAHELTTAGFDWRLVGYGGVGHSFTNPRARSPEQGLAYDARADARSWRELCAFLDELFGKG